MVLICILMVVIVAMVAFSVDVGRMYLVRSEMQTAVDAGALAATLQLQRDPDDIDAAVDAAKKFVQLNRVGWSSTVADEAITVEAGSWDAETHSFSTSGSDLNAVRVAAVTDEPLFFAGVMGQWQFAAPSDAIASAGDKKLDIIMTLDLSGSMGSNGRIQALQDASPVFIDVLDDVGSDDRVGVMGYGAIPGEYNPSRRGDSGSVYLDTPLDLFPERSNWVAVLEAPLTNDYNYLRTQVLNRETLEADKYNGWTPIGAALRDSAHYLNANAREDVDKVIVLMSDGHANKPDGNGPGYALDMARYAAGLDIKVYTISLGNAADDDLMEQIANITGAEFFKAGGSSSSLSEELADAFRGIASDIKRTQLVK
ncbi:MAG: VWA domain-containing protein [Pirellulaceae bacterium]